MKNVSLKIDGQPISVPAGTTILDAARRLGINIPVLCHHPKLSMTGACRVCIVEVGGQPVTSCTTVAENRMEVTTASPYIEGLRRDIVDLILSDHPYDCMVCERAGDCELQELAYKYQIRTPVFSGQRRIYTKRDGNPFIERDMEKCILCGRCVKVCDEVQGVGAIDYAYRGFETKICPPFERDLNCEFCGQCISVCPTGALVSKPALCKGRTRDVRSVESICPYCGCGCSITYDVVKNEVIRASSRPDTVNEGWLCVKGRFGFSFIHSPDRLTTPLIRRNHDLVPVSWEEAFSFIGDRLRKIRSDAGPDAIAGLSSARCTNEENYLFQKLMRAAVGTNNVDHCARY
ncbi:MAG TPA: 2Fe-2S iron-sulfur cluster-binding protein [Nitrospirota bacterium]|nr:2Fe-2S iron-sulfur cluster-binding protein [Nitrospirota bacterium]